MEFYIYIWQSNAQCGHLRFLENCEQVTAVKRKKLGELVSQLLNF